MARAVAQGNGSSKRKHESIGQDIELSEKGQLDASDENCGERRKCRNLLLTEDYVCYAAGFMRPHVSIGPYGYDPENGRFPITRMNALGLLLCPLRKPLPAEKWSPFEIAVFEASITLFGKQFNEIQKNVGTKTVKEIIEFYYDWKKTTHYADWKKNYIPDERTSYSHVFDED